MIPTMLLVGLVLGRRWAIPLGAVAWAAVLLIAGDAGLVDVPVAAALGGANVAVGVFVRWGLGRVLGLANRPSAPAGRA